MGEPLLACGRSGADEVYRLTWSHAFSQFDPYVIRGERSGSDARVSVSVFRYFETGEYGFGGLVKLKRVKRMTSSEKRLTMAEWTQLTRAVERADFWNSEHTLCFLEQIDGDCRVLEGRSGHGYHMPGHLPDVEDVLIRLSGLEHPQKGWVGSNRPFAR
jgi:hypothetical protein